MSDYEIDEIRRIRHRVSTDHGHDLRKVAEYYRNVEKGLRGIPGTRNTGDTIPILARWDRCVARHPKIPK